MRIKPGAGQPLNQFDRILGWTVSACGAVLLVASIAVVLAQCGWWLYSGEWAPVPLRLLVSALVDAPLFVSWAGVQKIIDFALDLPLVLYLIGCAVLVFSWGTALLTGR